MQFKPSPADEIALQHFAATPAGEAFRKQYDRNVAAAADAADAPPAATPATRGDSVASEPAATDGPSSAGATGPEDAGDGPEGTRAFRPLEWLRGRLDGDAGDAATAAEQEDIRWPGKGTADVNELPVFFVPGVTLSLPLQVRACRGVCPDWRDQSLTTRHTIRRAAMHAALHRSVIAEARRGGLVWGGCSPFDAPQLQGTPRTGFRRNDNAVYSCRERRRLVLRLM